MFGSLSRPGEPLPAAASDSIVKQPLHCRPCVRRDDARKFAGHKYASPRRVAPGLLIDPSPGEGVGNAGCQAHPQPCVQMKRARKQVTTSSAEHSRHSRTRMVLTVSFALAPETGLCCLRRRPRCGSIIANLTSASGCQAHTTSPSALKMRSSVAPKASIASRAQRS